MKGMPTKIYKSKELSKAKKMYYAGEIVTLSITLFSLVIVVWFWITMEIMYNPPASHGVSNVVESNDCLSPPTFATGEENLVFGYSTPKSDYVFVSDTEICRNMEYLGLKGKIYFYHSTTIGGCFYYWNEKKEKGVEINE